MIRDPADEQPLEARIAVLVVRQEIHPALMLSDDQVSGLPVVALVDPHPDTIAR